MKTENLIQLSSVHKLIDRNKFFQNPITAYNLQNDYLNSYMNIFRFYG